MTTVERATAAIQRLLERDSHRLSQLTDIHEITIILKPRNLDWRGSLEVKTREVEV